MKSTPHALRARHGFAQEVIRLRAEHRNVERDITRAVILNSPEAERRALRETQLNIEQRLSEITV